MKTLLILVIISFLTLQISFSQIGINNDGSAPDASAQLDVKSSTKGLLLPRLINRSNVIFPAAGLLIYNQNTNTPNYYNGSSWVDLSNGGFTIPYTATATNASDLISIIQNGSGHAIYGNKGYSASPLSFTDFAIVGESNANGGVLGITNSGTGIVGGSNTGIGVSGISNTNNGVLGTSTQANGIVGNSTNGYGIYGYSINKAGVYGYSGNSMSSIARANIGVIGESNDGSGVLGISKTGTGIYGDSDSWIGIFGSSNTGNGIYGTSLSGIGIYGVTGASIGGIGAGTAGLFVNYSPNGYGTGITIEKNVSFKGAYSINPAADIEIRHVNTGTWGLTGLRIFNATANKGWTFYTDAQGNLVLFQNNNFIGYFDPNDKNYHTNSDSRAKTNILTIPSILSKINLLSPKYYNYLNADKGTLGFIAQEVEKIFPVLVSKALDGKEYSLNYNGFGVLAVKAIQEQQEIINNQQSQIEDLVKRLDKQQAQINAILNKK